MHKGPAFFLCNLDWQLRLGLLEEGGAFGLAWEKRLLHFVQSAICEVVAEVKDLYVPLFEAHCHVALQLTKGEVRLHFFKRNVRGYLRKLRGTEWLQLVLDDVEPEHLHLDLGEVGELPEHDLVAHM